MNTKDITIGKVQNDNGSAQGSKNIGSLFNRMVELATPMNAGIAVAAIAAYTAGVPILAIGVGLGAVFLCKRMVEKPVVVDLMRQLITNEELLQQRIVDIKKEGPNAFGQALDIIRACCAHIDENRVNTSSEGLFGPETAPLAKNYSHKICELLEAIYTWNEQNNLICSLEDADTLNSLALTLYKLDSVYDQFIGYNRYELILNYISMFHLKLSENKNLLSAETLSSWLTGLLCLYEEKCYVTICSNMDAARNFNSMIIKTARKYEKNTMYENVFRSLKPALIVAREKYDNAKKVHDEKISKEISETDDTKGLLD